MTTNRTSRATWLRHFRLAPFALLLLGAISGPANAGATRDFGRVTEVRVEAADDDAIVGSLAGVPWEVHFEARAVGPTRAAIQVRVGEFRLDADIDLRTQSARLQAVHGHVSRDTREALGALAFAVERYLDPEERQLRVQESLLYRLTAFLSEAPAGVTFTTHLVTATLPEEHQQQTWPPGGVLATCQQADNDGIDYLSGGCALQSYPGICFDTRFQCFGCGTVSNGCGFVVGCPGRCGATCGAFSGFGAYTRDCAEHDECCDQNGGCTNPLSLDCGDEYWEAADDFLFGWILANCWGC